MRTIIILILGTAIALYHPLDDPELFDAAEHYDAHIVGGGPAGLLAAIEAANLGLKVVVYEKRLNYTRDVLFDVYGAPWWEGFERLADWGLFDCDATFKVTDIPGQIPAVSIQAHELERFLARRAVSSGVSIRFQRGPPADAKVVLYADGARSKYHEIEGVTRKVSDEVQHSAIITLEATDGRCPEEVADEWEAHPLFVGLKVRKVTAAYKRFQDGVCSVQVLFRGELPTGDALWRIFHRVLFVILVSPPPLKALRAAAEPSLRTISTRIRRTSPLAIVASGVLSAAIGDAAITAHYRLGVGINFAFGSARRWASWLRRADTSRPHAAAQAFHALQAPYVAQLYEFQRRVIRLESQCGLVITFDNDSPTLFDSLLIHKRLYSTEELSPPLSPEEVSKFCVHND